MNKPLYSCFGQSAVLLLVSLCWVTVDNAGLEKELTWQNSTGSLAATTQTATVSRDEMVNNPGVTSDCQQGYYLTKACMNRGKFGKLSSAVQSFLFVTFDLHELELFCREWQSQAKPCIVDVRQKFSTCEKLEGAFYGLVESYDYLCKDQAKEIYKKVYKCTTRSHFIKNAQYCARGFVGSVGGLDPRLATLDRYQILLEEEPKLQHQRMQTCTRINEYVTCQTSVIEYCGQAHVYIREFELKEKASKTTLTSEEEHELFDLMKKKKQIMKAANNFQKKFMQKTFSQHLGLLSCNRLSRLMVVMIIAVSTLVLVVLVCALPFCCRRRCDWPQCLVCCRRQIPDSASAAQLVALLHKKEEV